MTLESQIQSKVIRQLKAAGYFVTKLIQTSTNGIPDLLAIKDGRAIFIEVKTEKGKLSPLQDYRMKELNKYGVVTLTVTNTKDIDHLCTRIN